MVATKTLIRLCAKSAFYVGFPIGLLLIGTGVFFCIYFSDELVFILPKEYIIGIISIIGALLLIVFGRLLWKAGSRIKNYLDRDYPTIKASFLYTFHVSVRLFIFIFFLFIGCYAIYFWQLNQLENILPEQTRQIGICLGIIFSGFVAITIIGTLTTGLITMLIAKIVTTAASADLSLMEYAE